MTKQKNLNRTIEKARAAMLSQLQFWEKDKGTVDASVSTRLGLYSPLFSYGESVEFWSGCYSMNQYFFCQV